MAVSLTEINSFAADPEMTHGTPRVVIDNRDMLRAVSQGAIAKAENDRLRYTQFLNNFNEYLKTNSSDLKDVMPTDIAELSRDLKSAIGEAMNNPMVLANPFADPVKYAAINSKFQDINTKIAKSKSQNAFLTANKEYKSKNPSLQTPTNDALDLQYLNTTLKDRTEYMYQFPSLWSPFAVAQTSLERAKVKTPTSNFLTRVIKDDNTGELKEVEDPSYIRHTTKESYDRGIYDKTWEDLILTPTKTGRTLQEDARIFYNDKDNQSLRDAFPTFESYMQHSKDAFYNDKEVVTSDEIKENKIAIEQAKSAGAERLAHINGRYKVSTEQIKNNYERGKLEDAADGVLGQIASIAQGAANTGDNFTIELTGGKYINSKKINNIPPDMREAFARKGVGNDGKETTIYPDEIAFHQDNGTFSVLFYDYTADPTNPSAKETISRKNGKPIYNKSYSSFNIPFTTFATTFAKKAYPTATGNELPMLSRIFKDKYKNKWRNIPYREGGYLDDDGNVIP